MNRHHSMPQVVAVCLASVAACFLMGWRLGQYVFDRLGGMP